jgi:transposase
MRAQSEDLRHKVVKAVELGMSKAQAAHLFDVSLSSVKRYAWITREGGCLLRRIGARTSETLVEAMGRATCAVTTHDALGFFQHCGYQRASQPL